MRQFTATEAKNNFGVVLESSMESPVRITRSGQLVAVLISARAFDDLEAELGMVEAKHRLYKRDKATVELLTRFSMGELSSAQAVSDLGLSNYGQLLDLLGMAGLPLATVSPEEIERMAAAIRGVLDHE